MSARCLGFLFFENLQHWMASPFALVAVAFQIWMLVDAIRREEWMWVLFIILFPVFNAVLYYLMVYRASAPSGPGFELPGAADRRRIKELQAQIHHLDRAHHHSELGDIYFQQGKFDQAAQSYRSALEREPQDLDTRAHYGQCLLRLGRADEALPLLETVCAENLKHDYGYSLMALGETYRVLGKPDKSIATWLAVAENYSYARARVELADLYLADGRVDQAQSRLQEVLADDAHAPAFGRKQERFWIKRAKRMLRDLNRRPS